MSKYIIKRILQAVPLLIIITIIAFLIQNLAPGDPVYMFVDPENAQRVDLNAIRHRLGLDLPLYARYFVWLKNICTLNFGNSFVEGTPVIQMIGQRLPATLSLALVAVLFSFIVAIPAGIFSAIKKNSVVDYFFSMISFIGVSIPQFWFSLMLILLFSLKLGWLPSGGMRENFEQFVFMDRLKHMILPAFVMGTGAMAAKMRYMRASMIEAVSQDYVRTARSKGLSERIVIWKHALRNALLPIITLLGMIIPGLIGGSAIIETIFAWPGIGRMAIMANFGRDYPVLMGITLISSVLVIVGNLVADILYAVADPRIKYN